ncbi:hypothetical protein ACWCWG_40355, partial [Streptomyces hirsutus]
MATPPVPPQPPGSPGDTPPPGGGFGPPSYGGPPPLPADPAELWSTGPDVRAAAEVWQERLASLVR